MVAPCLVRDKDYLLRINKASYLGCIVELDKRKFLCEPEISTELTVVILSI